MPAKKRPGGKHRHFFVLLTNGNGKTILARTKRCSGWKFAQAYIKAHCPEGWSPLTDKSSWRDRVVFPANQLYGKMRMVQREQGYVQL